MAYISYLLLLILPVNFTGGISNLQGFIKSSMEAQEAPVYKVERLKKGIIIDANWDKSQWKKIEAIEIKHYMGKVSAFQPVVHSKMMYDDTNLYVIYQVKDRFVRSVTTAFNGPVSTDSCVEFFFAPDYGFPLKYFNLEINAGGTPLMFYVTKPRTDLKKLTPEELKEIQIAHSLPAIVDPEISEPVTWTIESKIPLSLLKKYSNVSHPAKGVKWKANFYKTGSDTSNPNYLTWSLVDNPLPDFHLPQFFGTLEFQ